MVEYDQNVIEEFATRLYSQAKATTMRHFFIGLCAGIVVFSAICNALNIGFDAIIIGIGTLICSIMGYGSGQNKAFEQKLQAQIALCQAKIEANTKR
jgi:hypothetical protein